MSEPTDTRDRVIRMETKLESVEKRLKDVEDKQDKIIDLLTEANGMRKIIRWMWAAALFCGGVGLTYWSSIKAMFIKIGG